MKTEIKWNADYNGVEIKTDDAHFVVDANPSYTMSWNDAMRFYGNPHRSHTWQLPTRERLKLIAEHIKEVNAIIRANGGYEIRGWLWTANEYDEFCAWYVFMYNGDTDGGDKRNDFYVRAVSAL